MQTFSGEQREVALVTRLHKSFTNTKAYHESLIVHHMDATDVTQLRRKITQLTDQCRWHPCMQCSLCMFNQRSAFL